MSHHILILWWLSNWPWGWIQDDEFITDSLKGCLAKSSTTSDGDPIVKEKVEILEKDTIMAKSH